MKTFMFLILLISSFLLISLNDAQAGGYYYSGGYDCYRPSFSFGFYGGSFYPPYHHYGYYPYYGYRPYSYGYYGRPYYGGYGYYGQRHYYGRGYGYYGRNYGYHRPYSYRSYRRYPRIQKPHYSRPSNPRSIRRR